MPPDALKGIKLRLESTITSAAKGHIPRWREFPIQYRTGYLKAEDGPGHFKYLRVVEIHGSCQFDAADDIHSRFIDEDVSDAIPRALVGQL